MGAEYIKVGFLITLGHFSEISQCNVAVGSALNSPVCGYFLSSISMSF